MSRSCLFYNSTSFSLEYSHTNSHLTFDLQVFAPHITTHTLPSTLLLLQKYQPSVLRTKCFNDKNLPFSEEVVNTELGHLFEHLFLDQLCMCKLEHGSKSARCKGETCWNWECDPVGLYHISVSAGRTSDQLLEDALTRSAAVFCAVLGEAQQTPRFSA